MKQIAFISDMHLDEEFPRLHGVDARRNWGRVLRDVAEKRISQIVVGGDIGTPDSHGWLFGTLRKYAPGLNLILGNHDAFADVTRHYQNPLMPQSGNELYYSFQDEQFRYVFMDSSADRVSPAQSGWLQNQLASARKVLLFIHHPVLAVNTAVDREYPLHGRELISDMLLAHPHPVKVFCGHYHMSDEQTQGNVQQFVTPAVSYQVLKAADGIRVTGDTFGYSIITIAAGHVGARGLICRDDVFVAAP